MNDRHVRGRWNGPATQLPSNTVMRYAVAAGDTGRIEYLDALAVGNMPALPYIGDTLTVPFMVHPGTRNPIPVRVVDIVEMLSMTPPTIAIVVGLVH